MTNMKRTSVSFTDDLMGRIYDLRKDERFRRCSYSELIRTLAELGLEVVERQNPDQDSA